MSNPLAIERSRKGKRQAIERIYERQVVGESFITNDTDLAAKIGMPKQDTRNARYDLEAIGSLKTTRKSLTGQRSGFATEWLLTEPKGPTLARLEAKWRKDDDHTRELLRVPNASKGKGSRTQAAQRAARMNGHALDGATPEHPVLPDVLVASKGPEAPKPLTAMAPYRKDEPRAMVEAARQYASVNSQLDGKVKELEALGVVVDRAAMAKAIKAPHDHVLLVVTQVLPYIEDLERQVQRLEAQNTDLRGKLEGLPELTERARRLSEQNQRLVGELHQLRNAKASREPAAPLPKSAAPVG